jgi:hypothetical protein
MGETAAEFVTEAVAFVSQHGWKFLPQYQGEMPLFTSTVALRVQAGHALIPVAAALHE